MPNQNCLTVAFETKVAGSAAVEGGPPFSVIEEGSMSWAGYRNGTVVNEPIAAVFVGSKSSAWAAMIAAII